jgi:N-acetylglucosamine malate deacetylase 2
MRFGKTLLVVAHSDDEIIAAGVRMLREPLAFHVLHVTDSAPELPLYWERAGCSSREDYAAKRIRESTAALAICGVDQSQWSMVEGIRDQETMLFVHRVVASIIDHCQRLRPEVLLTHAFEGGHPDHDACALACRLAMDEMDKSPWKPDLFEAPFYHHAHGQLTAGQFIHKEPALESDTIQPTAAELHLKRGMLACFETQKLVLERFEGASENVRRAPRYNFLQRPHEGPLYYETRPMTLKWDDWRLLAEPYVRGIVWQRP